MAEDEIKSRADFSPPVRPTSMPPQGKVWQVAGPLVLQSLALTITFAGALTRHVSDDFLQKMIEYSFIAVVASSTPKGVLDAIKAMLVKE